MNKFVKAVIDLNRAAVEEMLQPGSKWLSWSEKTDKNALHYICGVNVLGNKQKADAAFQIFRLLLKSGLDINSIHLIPDKNCGFLATPLWYAYTRGRNEKIYKYLLKSGANPDNCMFAIAWYDDIKAASLFKKHGAKITDNNGKDSPFLASVVWKKLAMAKWFLENEADVNFADDKGNTALHYAVKRGYDTKFIKLLLKFGADVDKKNKTGKKVS